MMFKAMSDREKRQRKPAIGYTRQSSATNVGSDKDGEVRQRKAIQAYANKAGYKIVEWISQRKRRSVGKCGGRTSYVESDPQMVALAQYLRGGNGWRP
jgi:hypothetical protein